MNSSVDPNLLKVLPCPLPFPEPGFPGWEKKDIFPSYCHHVLLIVGHLIVGLRPTLRQLLSFGAIKIKLN